MLRRPRLFLENCNRRKKFLFVSYAFYPLKDPTKDPVSKSLGKVGVSNGKCETLRDGETDTFSARPRLP